MRNVIRTGFSGQAAIAACTLFAVGVLSIAPALAQSASDSAIALTQRIDRLERELQTLNRSIYKDGAQVVPTAPAPTASAYADLASRIATLEDQLRNLTGQLEVMGNRIDQQTQQMERAQVDNDIRFKELEAKLGAGSPPQAVETQAQAPTDPVTPPAPTPVSADGAASPDSPTQQTLGQVGATQDAATLYESAYSHVRSKNFERARSEFATFLKAYPEHPLAANAAYWTAETYFASDDFATSARLFAETYQKYPQGPKAPDSILKLGLSLAAAGKTPEACIALRQLKKDFPAGDQAVLSRADKEISRLACS